MLLGSCLLGVVVVLAVIGPWIVPYDPLQTDFGAILQPPSTTHYFGTDELGRDVFSRVIVATRSSLVVSLIAVSIGLVGGTSLGMLAAYYGGILDATVMRLLEVLFAFPAILLAIILMAGLGTNTTNAMIAIGITFIPGFARVARATTQAVMTAQFVEVSRTFGMPSRRILVREILPNIQPTLLTQAAVGLGTAVIIESALSFLGLGTQPPFPSWGNMVADGLALLRLAPWITMVAGLAIFITVLAANLIGDGLRDYLDPRFGDHR